jgi:hypothetical protein
MNKTLAMCLSILFLSFASLGAKAATKDWTVMVFLNGHNSLDSYGQQNIDSMTQVGSSDRVNVVVEWATESANTRRIYIKNGSYDVIQDMGGKVDMGDYNNFVEFATWTAAHYPAKKYLVVVWDHGNGWHLQSYNSKSHGYSPRDLSYDDLTGHVITTEQLGIALAQIAQATGGPIELYGSDACLMAMAEVAAEVQGSVKYFAGSQEVEPGAGWPYAPFLAHLVAHPEWSGAQAGITLAQDYRAAYSGGVYGNSEVTFSALDMSKFDKFLVAMKSFSTDMDGLSASGISGALAANQASLAFELPDYKDLGDFLDNVQAHGMLQGARSVSDLRSVLHSMTLASENTSTFAKAHGLSIWLPTESSDWTNYSERYKAMKFNNRTRWGDFLTREMSATPSN